MKDSNAGFHLGNLIKKHIYFRNKSVKEVAMHLDLNEKTFSDHLNKSKMLSDELFDIADYLELSLDYLGSMSKNKPGLLGQKVCRLNKTSHNKANELVSCEIEKIKSRMCRLGAVCSQMSGSGSAVFGLFDKEDRANLCFDELKKDGLCEVYFFVDDDFRRMYKGE
jgi:hypothetical protein